MENSNPCAAGSSQNTPTGDIFTAAYTSISDDEDIASEWEYEYSTTESEIYYLTLDLSTPEVPPTHLPFDETVRRKTRWLNPSIGRHRRQTPMPPANRTAKTYTLDGRRSPDENEDLEKATDDEGEAVGGFTSKENSKEIKSVQILDLQSSHPVVAFDGHVYACSWAENIGTELNFTPHDKDDPNPLPKLRTLRGGIDLLACCSARLIAKSVKLTPLDDPRLTTAKPRDRNQVLIPVGHAASQQRKDQALFLEKLILAKEKRGELDCVTVNAKPRLPPRKLRTLFEEKRSHLKSELRKDLKRKIVSKEEKESVKKRLVDMNNEDLEWASRGDGFSKAGRNGGRPKKVPLGDGKITKSTLWSQRNVKGKGKGRAKEVNTPPDSPAGGEGSYCD